MYIVSLIPALLLVAALGRALLMAHGHQENGLALMVCMVVCATHAGVLVMYPIRRTKPLALLAGVMAFVSLLCFFLLLISSGPNYQVQGIIPSGPAPTGTFQAR